jgi:hypothetical protein
MGVKAPDHRQDKKARWGIIVRKMRGMRLAVVCVKKGGQQKRAEPSSSGIDFLFELA